MSVNGRPDGFEFEGTFYPWHVEDIGKDLVLIERIAAVPYYEFVDRVLAGDESMTIRLGMIATSIRHAHPEWGVDRIYAMVMGMHASAIEWVMGEEEELEPGSPPTTPPSSTGERSSSESRSTSSDTGPERSGTSNAIPASYGPPGWRTTSISNEPT